MRTEQIVLGWLLSCSSALWIPAATGADADRYDAEELDNTISPFFCSQERMLQGVVRDGQFRFAHQMPCAATNPFAWSASELDSDNCAGILQSYDGTAYVARVQRPPCRVGGNSSIPCMHLGNWNEELTPVPKNVDGEGGKVIFLVGSLDDLNRELHP